MRRVRLLAALLALRGALRSARCREAGRLRLVISQVYGGGGNAGAPFANDYVELFNSGATPVGVTGWSVQYATAAGHELVGDSVERNRSQPGKYYLVQLAGGTRSGAALPAAGRDGLRRT